MYYRQRGGTCLKRLKNKFDGESENKIDNNKKKKKKKKRQPKAKKKNLHKHQVRMKKKQPKAKKIDTLTLQLSKVA